jgi:type II pantothenate kinase
MDLHADLRRIEADPDAFPDLSIATLCRRREQFLARHSFVDPFRLVKERENAAALQLLPELLRELDQTVPAERLLKIAQGLFAGNMFDFGSMATIEMYDAGEMAFQDVRGRLPSRPWRIDDFDAFRDRVAAARHRKAVLFVDNAGSDVVLGMIPLARYLLALGLRVVMAANTHPALNDITYDELVPLLEQIAMWDTAIREALADDRLTVVPSGNDLPVIDLSKVSGPLAQAARDADLLILEGMGRALETNYNTQFTVDTLKVAIIKDENVAQHFDAQMYGIVCRFEPCE